MTTGREQEVKTLLEKEGFVFEHDETLVIGCRPDFLFKGKSFWVILEVDEEAHRSYNVFKEIFRMEQISEMFSYDCQFIRYNPDFGSISERKSRQEQMITQLREVLSQESLGCKNPDPIYIGYDVEAEDLYK